MFSVLLTDEFDRWLNKLKDAKAKARIVAKLRSAEMGNLGDVKPIGEGISEMRIHYGPGYRLYFVKQDEQIIILLSGGDKSSQKRDIEKAKRLKAEL